MLNNRDIKIKLLNRLLNNDEDLRNYAKRITQNDPEKLEDEQMNKIFGNLLIVIEQAEMYKSLMELESSN